MENEGNSNDSLDKLLFYYSLQYSDLRMYYYMMAVSPIQAFLSLIFSRIVLCQLLNINIY